MSPKMTEYPKKLKSKTRPMATTGNGVGFTTGEEKKEYDMQKKITFTLINLTPLAGQAKENDSVYPIYSGDALYINNSEGSIGEAPADKAKVVIKIIKQGFRPEGFISVLRMQNSKLHVEVTLSMRKD